MIRVGLDWHKRYVMACALDATGTEMAAHRRLPADAEALNHLALVNLREQDRAEVDRPDAIVDFLETEVM